MPVFKEKDLDSVVDKNKGSEVYDCMLLRQYINSTNLRAYSDAFLVEFDALFEQMERVYLGRFLEYAKGEQLTTLGHVVGVSRELTLEELNFGFELTSLSGTFTTTGDSSLGEKFLSLNPEIVQLSDSVFRRVVRAKALCNGAQFHNIEFMYNVISILIGRIPTVFRLEHDINVPNEDQFGFLDSANSSTFGSIGDISLGGVWESLNPTFSYSTDIRNNIILTLERSESPTETLSLINVMKKYFLPVGYKLEFNLI